MAATLCYRISHNYLIQRKLQDVMNLTILFTFLVFLYSGSLPDNMLLF